jgi:hypothetical protein
MEEEGERLNPVNPKKAVKKGAVSYADVPRTSLVASGATPSMGLSKVRGGGKLEIVHHEEADSDEEHAEEAGGLLANHIKGLHGAGYLKKFHSGLSRHLAEEKAGGMNTGAYEGEGLAGGAHPGVPVVGGITAGPGFYEASGKKKRAPSDARKKRGAMMSRLMKSRGMSLGEASKYIKEHPELV